MKTATDRTGPGRGVAERNQEDMIMDKNAKIQFTPEGLDALCEALAYMGISKEELRRIIFVTVSGVLRS